MCGNQVSFSIEVLPRITKMVRLSRKWILLARIIVLLCIVEESTAYRTYNRGVDVASQFTNHKQSGIKERFHPLTHHSIEDSKEMDLEPDADVQVQYAYEGGDSHDGEILVSNDHEHQGYDAESLSHNHDDSIETIHHHHDLSHPPSPFGGYHYGHPYPPPRPPPRPTTRPPPHKSKQKNDAEYAYYYIGRQLWYVPLYFSIYFVAYVGLLVLKSIARHKVLLPQLSEQAAINAQGARKLSEVQRSISEAKQKYYM